MYVAYKECAGGLLLVNKNALVRRRVVVVVGDSLPLVLLL